MTRDSEADAAQRVFIPHCPSGQMWGFSRIKLKLRRHKCICVRYTCKRGRRWGEIFIGLLNHLCVKDGKILSDTRQTEQFTLPAVQKIMLVCCFHIGAINVAALVLLLFVLVFP
jgi:hypothetical protein